ncbi:MAG: EamA family transporter, partial [Acidiferrobacteraceae bacterium]|nr:EamA family transporter [Acidiferrobacteraceae bacterium]
MSNYRRGVLMILGSAFFLSTSGIGLRIIEQANGWQILFYRSISMMLMVFVVLAFTHRGQVIARFRRLTGEDWLLAVVLGSGFVAYVFALLETTVANA